MIGNKTDLEAERQVAEKAARDLADSLGIKYFETSAKTGENVNEAIDALLEQVSVYISILSFFFYRIVICFCNMLSITITVGKISKIDN